MEKADLLPSTSKIQDVLPIPHMSRQVMCLPSGLVFSSFWNLIIFRTVHLLRSVSSIFIHSLILQIFILQTIWAKPWKFRFIKHDPSPQVTPILWGLQASNKQSGCKGTDTLIRGSTGRGFTTIKDPRETAVGLCIHALPLSSRPFHLLMPALPRHWVGAGERELGPSPKGSTVEETEMLTNG